MNLHELEAQLEVLHEEYWNANDGLGRIALARAVIMNKIKDGDYE